MGLWKDYILFERTILCSAWEKSWGFFKHHLAIEIFVSIALAIGGFVAGLMMQPLGQLEQLENAFVIAVLTALIAVVLMFFAIGLSYLLSTPFSLWRNQKRQIDLLQTAVLAKHSKAETTLVLSQILERGNALLIKKIEENEVKKWMAEVDDFWTLLVSTVKEYMSVFHTVDLNTAVVREPTNFEHAKTKEHNEKLNFMDVTLQKLRNIIQEQIKG